MKHPMTRTSTASTVLLVAGIVLLTAPALFPIQPVLVHDATPGTVENASAIRADGYSIVAYENLSERGRELYVRTLRNGGEYSVPAGEGAPDFSYPTSGELGDADGYRERTALEGVAVERPPDADLPPPAEPLDAAEHLRERFEATNRTAPSQSELRRRIARYDLLTTRTDRPPLRDPASLARLVAAAAGVLALGVGGYLRSKPR